MPFPTSAPATSSPASSQSLTRWESRLLRFLLRCFQCWATITILEALFQYIGGQDSTNDESARLFSGLTYIWNNLTWIRLLDIAFIAFINGIYCTCQSHNAIVLGISLFFIRESIWMIGAIVHDIGNGVMTAWIWELRTSFDAVMGVLGWDLDWEALSKCAKAEGRFGMGRYTLMYWAWWHGTLIMNLAVGLLMDMWIQKWAHGVIEAKKKRLEEERRREEMMERNAEEDRKKKFEDYLAWLERRRREDSVASTEVERFVELEGVGSFGGEVVEEPGWEDAFGDRESWR